MKCSRCSTEVSDAPTFCPQCGTSMRSIHPSTFSYLPANTPPWPTTFPTQTPSIVESAPVSSSRSLSGIAAAPRSRQQATNILSTIAVLVLAPVLGTLLTMATLASNGLGNSHAAKPVVTAKPQTSPSPQAQATSTPLPIPNSFKTAEDSNVNISLKYPAEWNAATPKKSTTSASLNITSQDQLGIAFYITHYLATASGAIQSSADLNQSNLSQLGQLQDFHGVQEVTSSTPTTTIAGDNWQQNEATLLDAKNNKYHFTTISVKHSQTYYAIYFFVPGSIYPEAMQKYLAPMLSSVKFLS